MDLIHEQEQGYSSKVEIQLVRDGKAYPIGRVGPTYATLRSDCSMPPGMAQIAITIDGSTDLHDIILSKEIVPGDRYIEFF
jgi:hypothetical protein